MKREIEELIHKEFLVGRLLGSGTTGEVYEVIHKSNHYKYAMKVSEKKHILRLEAEMMTKIQSKVFPQIFDYKEAELGYLIMECIEGKNLQDMLDGGILFEMRESVWIVSAVLQGLDYLHKQMPAMVYRDLKPSNIIIDTSGEVRLIDLGSVAYSGKSQESESLRAGTYGYAAPEQFWPEMIPMPHWDVYAAGKLLGYLLTGHNPAIPPYDVEEYYKKDKKVPWAMKAVLNRSLSKQGQARYADAELMLAELQMALEETEKKKWYVSRGNRDFEYKKCIWLSEYRRIF